MDIAKKLRALRQERKESQEKVARAIDIALVNYQRIEREKGLPSLPVFIALADHFEVNADYLLGRTDVRDMLPPPSEGSQ